ncbi:HNH endonuclease [Vibrio parahaemolyticus]|nr:HNH endonuclease [Vibrio parahaemolyticus]EJR2791844.1 HNH endonuclease [Vibrio parahaemolyticus]MBY7811703.1 HNH endonuclease [Vibrio fluvialis]
MQLSEYIASLPTKRKLSDVKLKILERLWGRENDTFPKAWVASEELLSLTGQKYFDRRARELRDQLGCDIETSHREEFSGHAWRIRSNNLAPPKDRDYLTEKQKKQLFDKNGYHCATCGLHAAAGVRGLQADHKIPLSKGGGNEITNWQPMCNNCNVGKRRACEGCDLDCAQCSWAFPEKVGIKTILSLTPETLKQLECYCFKNNLSKEDAIKVLLSGD